MMTDKLMTPGTSLHTVNLQEWMRGGRKIIVQHGARPYCLSITRRGKLILTAAEDKAEAPSAVGQTKRKSK